MSICDGGRSMMRSPRQQKINPIYNNTEQPEQNQTNLNLLRTHKSSFISKVEIRVGLNLVWRFTVDKYDLKYPDENEKASKGCMSITYVFKKIFL